MYTKANEKQHLKLLLVYSKFEGMQVHHQSQKTAARVQHHQTSPDDMSTQAHRPTLIFLQQLPKLHQQ